MAGQYYDELFSSLRSPIAAVRESVLDGNDCSDPGAQGDQDLRCGSIPADVCTCPGEGSSPHRPVRVLWVDMRTHRLSQTVELITCELDAFIYVPHRADLRIVVKAAVPDFEADRNSHPPPLRPRDMICFTQFWKRHRFKIEVFRVLPSVYIFGLVLFILYFVLYEPTLASVIVECEN